MQHLKQDRINDYDFHEYIASGTHAVVCHATHLLSGIDVAVKIIQKSSLTDEAAHIDLKRELDTVNILDHPFIAKYFEHFDDDKHIYIVMEYIPGGTLLDKLNDEGPLKESEARLYFQQLIEILDYLHHSAHIVHRDIKAENILFDSQGNLRLIDFGLSNFFDSPGSALFRTGCGSPEYSAPEIIENKEYTTSVDIWSAGIILYAMFTGRLPFHGVNPIETFRQITTQDPFFPLGMPSDVQSIISGLLNKDPTMRFTIEDIRSHPWFTAEPRDFTFLKSLSFSPFAPEQEVVDTFISAYYLQSKIRIQYHDLLYQLQRHLINSSTVSFSIFYREVENQRCAYYIGQIQEALDSMTQSQANQYTCLDRPNSSRSISSLLQPSPSGGPYGGQSTQIVSDMKSQSTRDISQFNGFLKNENSASFHGASGAGKQSHIHTRKRKNSSLHNAGLQSIKLTKRAHSNLSSSMAADSGSLQNDSFQDSSLSPFGDKPKVSSYNDQKSKSGPFGDSKISSKISSKTGQFGEPRISSFPDPKGIHYANPAISNSFSSAVALRNSIPGKLGNKPLPSIL